MELKKDDIWEGFEAITSLQSFNDNMLQQLYFKDEVSQEIKDDGRLIQTLLLHSYYEYAFIEIAITQAICLLDKALSLRWKQLFGKRPKGNFEALIQWFFDNGYFETLEVERIHGLRKLRNKKVHKIDNGVGGVGIIHNIYWLFDRINDLYESPELRKTRLETYYSLLQQFAEFVRGGVIVSVNEVRYLAFSVSPIFFDNKSEPAILHLFISLIFDPRTQADGKIHYSNLKLSVSNWKFNGSCFEATNIADGSALTIKKITDKENGEKFEKWHNDFNALSNSSLLLFEIFEPITKLNKDLLKAFYKNN
ncbi:MAG: hypothetical protein JST70_14065 [Bacteroidetes bacterium]|nr:hypothetical protein [Bacteroidota bacterium]